MTRETLTVLFALLVFATLAAELWRAREAVCEGLCEMALFGVATTIVAIIAFGASALVLLMA